VSKFLDAFEAQACLLEVNAFENEIAKWVIQEGNMAVEEADNKTKRAADRFNCYARGEDFCF
jgi:hypothetical protein